MPQFINSATLSEQLSNPDNDKDLFDGLNQLRNENQLKDFHPHINRLIKELMMYQMVHSFIKNCVSTDITIGLKASQSCLKELLILRNESPDSNKEAVKKFFARMQKEYGNVFSVKNLGMKIHAMYESLNQDS